MKIYTSTVVRNDHDGFFRYAAYHHLRSKGWVVRGGHSLGCDWLVYRLGPPFYHASNTVRVEAVDGLTGRPLQPDTVRPLSWDQLIGLSR
jgi:tRNA-splicing endonuclease subunit Sen2